MNSLNFPLLEKYGLDSWPHQPTPLDRVWKTPIETVQNSGFTGSIFVEPFVRYRLIIMKFVVSLNMMNHKAFLGFVVFVLMRTKMLYGFGRQMRALLYFTLMNIFCIILCWSVLVSVMVMMHILHLCAPGSILVCRGTGVYSFDEFLKA